MEFGDILKIVAAALGTFGGGAVIFMGLAKWWGDLLAKRILQTESGKIETRLEAFSHELNLARRSYDYRLDLVVDYYAKFWKHFQLCKRSACSEQTRDRVTGEMKATRDMYLNRIEVELKE